MIVSPLLALTLPAALAEELPTPEPMSAYTAVAQDEDEEEEEDEDGGKKAKKKKKDSGEDERRIREIVRGFYAKANIGAATYLLNFTDKGGGTAVSTGTLVNIAFGQDFVDSEKQSMAWEISINQGVHNGLEWGASGYGQADYGCVKAGTGPYPCTEGDLRTYSLQASYEFSAYPVRRIGIGFRAGAGALYSPLLLESVGYTEDVLPAYGVEPGMHNTVHPYGFAGPTFEYYTKLSHFSVGVDVDVFYALDWDLGLNASAALKYTF